MSYPLDLSSTYFLVAASSLDDGVASLIMRLLFMLRLPIIVREPFLSRNLLSEYPLLRKGITIPPEFFPMLPNIVREFTKSQINQINKAYQTGGQLVIKPTRKQIEGGFLGTLASIGIPMAISLVSKMFGGGLHVDRSGLSNISNVYIPPTHGEGYPYRSPPFIGTWENPIGMGVKKKKPADRPKARVYY